MKLNDVIADGYAGNVEDLQLQSLRTGQLSVRPSTAPQVPLVLNGLPTKRSPSDISRAATAAIPYVRSLLPLKSDNKDYGEDDSLIPKTKLARYAEDARDNRTILLNKLQCEMYALEQTWKQSRQAPDFGALAHIIASKGIAAAGNCYEQAILAYDFLRKSLPDGSIPLDVVSLKPPGNHNFVAIGQRPDANGRYPKQFSDWDKDAFIIDPWSKIACSARDYPTKWTEKMNKWEARGLRLDDGSPLAANWLNALDDNDKISRRNAFPTGGTAAQV